MMSRGTPELVICPNAQELAETAAQRFVQAALAACAARGRFMVALSGGSTPKALFHLLAVAPYRDQVDWSAVHVYWGDERPVPPEDDQSNYHMAYEALLRHVPVPADQIHRIVAEHPDHEAAATAYEHTLRQTFGIGANAVPVFDLIYLGLGTEGHTASLFPDSPALDDTTRCVAAPWVEKLHTVRLTVTPPVLNAAREVQFLVAGAEKAAIVWAILHDPYQPHLLPAQIVAPQAGRLVWLLDAAAAADLPPTH